MSQNDKLILRVNVTNTGRLAGAETVQCYIADKECSVERPVKELKAFQKVWLQPGETREVQLTIDRRSLSFYDSAQGQWVAEPGPFEALIGTSAGNIISSCTFMLK